MSKEPGFCHIVQDFLIKRRGLSFMMTYIMFLKIMILIKNEASFTKSYVISYSLSLTPQTLTPAQVRAATVLFILVKKKTKNFLTPANIWLLCDVFNQHSVLHKKTLQKSWVFISSSLAQPQREYNTRDHTQMFTEGEHSSFFPLQKHICTL